jgi:hypothetical protein
MYEVDDDEILGSYNKRIANLSSLQISQKENITEKINVNEITDLSCDEVYENGNIEINVIGIENDKENKNDIDYDGNSYINNDYDNDNYNSNNDNDNDNSNYDDINDINDKDKDNHNNNDNNDSNDDKKEKMDPAHNIVTNNRVGIVVIDNRGEIDKSEENMVVTDNRGDVDKDEGIKTTEEKIEFEGLGGLEAVIMVHPLSTRTSTSWDIKPIVEEIDGDTVADMSSLINIENKDIDNDQDGHTGDNIDHDNKIEDMDIGIYTDAENLDLIKEIEVDYDDINPNRHSENVDAAWGPSYEIRIDGVYKFNTSNAIDSKLDIDVDMGNGVDSNPINPHECIHDIDNHHSNDYEDNSCQDYYNDSDCYKSHVDDSNDNNNIGDNNNNNDDNHEYVNDKNIRYANDDNDDSNKTSNNNNNDNHGYNNDIKHNNNDDNNDGNKDSSNTQEIILNLLKINKILEEKGFIPLSIPLKTFLDDGDNSNDNVNSKYIKDKDGNLKTDYTDSNDANNINDYDNNAQNNNSKKNDFDASNIKCNDNGNDANNCTNKNNSADQNKGALNGIYFENNTKCNDKYSVPISVVNQWMVSLTSRWEKTIYTYT